MNKFKTFTALMLLLAIGFAGCGKSEAERHRLSKKEKARLDSLDRAAAEDSGDANNGLPANLSGM